MQGWRKHLRLVRRIRVEALWFYEEAVGPVQLLIFLPVRFGHCLVPRSNSISEGLKLHCHDFMCN